MLCLDMGEACVAVDEPHSMWYASATMGTLNHAGCVYIFISQCMVSTGWSNCDGIWALRAGDPDCTSAVAHAAEVAVSSCSAWLLLLAASDGGQSGTGE